LAQPLAKNGYGHYLLRLVEEERRSPLVRPQVDPAMPAGTGDPRLHRKDREFRENPKHHFAFATGERDQKRQVFGTLGKRNS
jgi:hypothetical protein